MYSIEDTSAALARLQTYLLEISYATKGLPHIAVDGVAGEETNRAVRLFQRRVGLPETGYADRMTWESAVRHYRLALGARKNAPPLLPPEALPLAERAVGSEVLILQAMLSDLHEDYPAMPRPMPTGRYDTETSEAVRVFQHHHSLPASGTLDGVTWEILADEYGKKREKTGRIKEKR